MTTCEALMSIAAQIAFKIDWFIYMKLGHRTKRLAHAMDKIKKESIEWQKHVAFMQKELDREHLSENRYYEKYGEK